MIQIKFGSAPTNNVVLNHPTISPVHLEIVQDDQGNFLLTDLNSWHGTFVNGYKIQGMVQLRPTDIVKAGELVLPWINYFQYQQTPPVAEQSTVPPIAGIPVQPQFSTTPVQPQTSSTPYSDAFLAPKKPVNKKKLFAIIGGSVVVLLLAIVGLIYLYTRPSYKHLKLIPSNAFVVASMNLKSIAGKIDMEKMQKMEFFLDMKDKARDNSDALRKAMGDPMSSGIDVFSQPYGFMCMAGDDRMKFTGGVTFAIKNENDFRVFVQRLSRDEEIIRSDKFSYMKLDRNSCIAWNDDAGIILVTDRSGSRMENYCRSLFEQKEEESILSVESFPTFQKAQYDIGFYMNYDAMRSFSGVTIPAYLRGSSSMATIIFNDGKLSYTNEYFQGATSSGSPRGLLGKKGINDELKNSIPGKSYGIASASLDIQTIYNFMEKDPKMVEVLDDIARGLRVERSVLPGILSGDLYFSLADVKQTTFERMHYDYDYESYEYNYITTMDTTVTPTYIFAATVKDPAILEGIIEQMRGKDTVNGIKFWPVYRQGNNYLAHHNKNYFICNDFELANQLAQTGKATSPVSGIMASLLSTSPVYSYFNLNLSKYPKVLPAHLEHEFGRRDYRDFNTCISIFDYAELSGDGVMQVLDVHFIDKGNCLNTFLKTGNEIYLNHNHH